MRLPRLSGVRTTELNPGMSFAYFIPIAIAMREGQFTEVQDLINVIIESFPEPDTATRALNLAFGAESPVVLVAETFGFFALRQWNETIVAMDQIEASYDDAFFTLLPDVFSVGRNSALHSRKHR